MPPRKPQTEATILRAKVERHDGEGLILALAGYPGGTLDVHFVPHSPVARLDHAIIYAGKAGAAAAIALVEEAKRVAKPQRAALKASADVIPAEVLLACGFVSQAGEYVCNLREKDL